MLHYIFHCMYFILSLFWKMATTHKIIILQEKQEGGSILHLANAFRVRISPTCLGYSLKKQLSCIYIS